MFTKVIIAFRDCCNDTLEAEQLTDFTELDQAMRNDLVALTAVKVYNCHSYRGIVAHRCDRTSSHSTFISIYAKSLTFNPRFTNSLNPSVNSTLIFWPPRIGRPSPTFTVYTKSPLHTPLPFRKSCGVEILGKC